MNSIEQLAEMIRETDHFVVLTGAGISTMSGIPDFRSKGGLYETLDAEKVFDLHYFLKDQSYYYGAMRDLIYELEEKKPNIVHDVLARLQRLGHLKALITQNIDLLHTRAGSPDVIEVHGSPVIHTCLSCGAGYDFPTICEIVGRGGVPRCAHCGGIIKPGITFFGEMLDAAALGRAMSECTRATLTLVLGSSLSVYPAAMLPVYTLQNGGRIAIVNRGETSLDRECSWRHDDLEVVFNGLGELFPESV